MDVRIIMLIIGVLKDSGIEIGQIRSVWVGNPWESWNCTDHGVIGVSMATEKGAGYLILVVI